MLIGYFIFVCFLHPVELFICIQPNLCSEITHALASEHALEGSVSTRVLGAVRG